MNERIKKKIVDAVEEFFIPAFVMIWGLGLAIVSFLLVISVLWNVFSFF